MHAERLCQSPGVDVVRAVLKAYGEGRVDDMLALIHPEIEWRPLTRPGLTVYRGHDGIRQMVRDGAKARGAHRNDFREFIQLADGRVVARGRVLGGDEIVDPSIEKVFEFRDGLLARAEADSPVAD